jgi:nucleotidyltransferase substrate binding protein (TIGR01987 family)
MPRDGRLVTTTGSHKLRIAPPQAWRGRACYVPRTSRTLRDAMPHDIRWIRRFEHLARAVALLGEPIARGVESLSVLEREGTVQRFEVALELAWKTMKDFLEHEGEVLAPVTPKGVVKAAFAAGVVADGQVWIDMLDHRNLLAQTYDAVVFEDAVVAVRDRYLAAFEGLVAFFAGRTGAP